MQSFIAISALLAIACAAPQYAPVPAYAPAPVYAPAPAYAPAPVYADIPPAYDYGYAVNDGYSGANFAANENRNGYTTNGEYRVALPDGRTQIVTYSVLDAQSGYVADVRYEGAPIPYAAPAPAYAPAPIVPAYGNGPL